MKTALWILVILSVFEHELRFAAFQFVQPWTRLWRAFLRILPSLLTQLLQQLRPLLLCHLVVVALGHQARHVIHRARRDGFDSFVHGSGIQCHPTPTADTDDSNAVALN